MTIEKQPAIRYLLDILGKKWTFEILDALLHQELRFSELEDLYPGLSGKMLSRRVKELFEKGLIGKAVSSIHPLEFKYYLSDAGKQLRSVFYEMGVVTAKIFRNEILEDPSLDSYEIEKYYQKQFNLENTD